MKCPLYIYINKHLANVIVVFKHNNRLVVSLVFDSLTFFIKGLKQESFWLTNRFTNNVYYPRP
jgi:hypothetical protein